MNRKEYNAYMRKYLKKRYEERRKFALEYLGNKCVNCGTIEGLEFDHIDPKKRSFTIGKRWLTSMESLISELDKCQLLCRNCHEIKTKNDGSLKSKKTYIICNCGREFYSDKSYCGHKAFCKL